MKQSEKRPTGIITDNSELRKLISDNPDLPIVFLANEDANNGEYSTMFCTFVSARIGEVLDCQQEIDDEVIYTDREAFEDKIFEDIETITGYYDRPEKWYEAETKRIASEYEPYWKPCILITVGN